MKIASEHLLRWWTSPGPITRTALAQLLDDVGIEVKRSEEGGTLLSLELLANRGDHRCYLGIARELHGRMGGTLVLPTCDPVVVGAAPVPLSVLSPLCLRYCLTALTLPETPGALDEADLLPVLAAGLSSVSAAVDATNITNLEFGQPTHLFDADTVVGGVTVRESRAGETCRPLFSTRDVSLPVGTLVIADDVKVLAVAGVIGCEESKVTNGTRRALLESATFDPVAVRKASRALGIHTDASARFERGADPSLVEVGAGRVLYLLRSRVGAEVVGETALEGSWVNPQRTLVLDPERVSHTLGRRFPVQEILSRLCRLGFDCWQRGSEVEIEVPPGRTWDIHHVEDLYEELARSVGYNDLPATLPSDTLGVSPTPGQESRERVEEVLLGAGFYEVITNGFYSRELIDPLPVPQGHALRSHVSTENALDRAFSLLKNNTLVQALDTVAQALRYGQQEVRAYEYSRVFLPDPTAPNGLCRERQVLWAVSAGPARAPSWQDKSGAADVWLMRGLVEELAAELRQVFSFRPGPVPEMLVSDLLHPARRAAILHEGQVVGILGEIEPDLVAAYGVKRQRPIYLEINVEVLLISTRSQSATLPPARPPSVRSLAFTLPHRVEAEGVAQSLRTAAAPAGKPRLSRVEVADLFVHEAPDGGLASRTVTYTLNFPQEPTSFSEEQINAAVFELVGVVERRWGAAGVHLRGAI